MSQDPIRLLVDQTEDLPVSEVSIFRHSVYLRSASVGLASTVNTSCQESPRDAGALHLLSTRRLAARALSPNLLEAAVGLAAINSTLNTERVLERTSPINAFALLEERMAGRNVSVIGGFPATQKLRERRHCRNLWVFELAPSGEGELPATRLGEYLPLSEIVLITATTLLNRTFPQIQAHLGPSYNVLVGPSTPLHPLLFEFKLDALCGTVVTDPEAARRSLSQGAPYRETQGLSFVTLFKDRPDAAGHG